MSPTFFVTLIVALVAVFYWRVVAMIAIAVLLAFVLMGISTVSDVLDGQKGEHPTVVAPAQPAQQSDGAVPGSDEHPVPEGEPRTQDQPSLPR